MPVPVTVAGFRLVVAALYEVLVAEALPVQAALKADPATGARRAQRGRLRDVRRAAVVDAQVEESRERQRSRRTLCSPLL
ncbi:hypothetical protein OG389_00675 [Streptomyces sp. NBC_00435]|uniref:hypothetical protein n=1 Tax=Streptomyces sp. NBC_00435 TaxID=2903649 RepID=UPI002E2371B9